MIKAVIFDLDGTLVNAYPAVADSVNNALNALGLKNRSPDEIKRSVGGGDRKLLACFVGEKRADEALRIYRPHHAKALLAFGGVKLEPGALTLLTFLKKKGFKLAIASNRPSRFTRIILQKLGIKLFFDRVRCADQVKRPKPYPDLLWDIARKFRLKESELLYVGDMTIDIACAHKAGVRMVAVATGSSSKKELNRLKPWRIISRIDKLKAIIKEEYHE
ncbi:MAG: HAD family hydrolase [Candidatus Omnitrophica bacterium]|nr:HAD family hydrolase [Candidatus Omnitrophota bacterium]